MTDALLNVSLRTAGKLTARGVFTHAEAAAFIRSAWAKHSLEAMPAGSTSNAWAAAMFAEAVANDWWCGCGEHRVQGKGARCPSCLDDARRAS